MCILKPNKKITLFKFFKLSSRNFSYNLVKFCMKKKCIKVIKNVFYVVRFEKNAHINAFKIHYLVMVIDYLNLFCSIYFIEPWKCNHFWSNCTFGTVISFMFGSTLFTYLLLLLTVPCVHSENNTIKIFPWRIESNRSSHPHDNCERRIQTSKKVSPRQVARSERLVDEGFCCQRRTKLKLETHIVNTLFEFYLRIELTWKNVSNDAVQCINGLH